MLATIIGYIGVASFACSLLSAALPVPAASGWTASAPYRVFHAIINAAAVNHFNAANAKQPEARA